MTDSEIMDLQITDPLVRFNLAALQGRRGFEQVIGRTSAAGAEAEAAAFDFVRGWAGQMAGIAAQLDPASAAAAGGWINGLLELAGEDPDGEPPLEPSLVGPGRAGWTGRIEAGGERLVYTRAVAGGGQRTLAFRRVTPASADVGPFFIAETEAPAWLLTEVSLLSSGGEPNPVSSPVWGALSNDPGEGQQDTRSGPRSWAWGADDAGRRGPRVPPSWLRGNTGAGGAFYPAEFENDLQNVVGVPTADHPLNRVRPGAAVLLAQMVGCRLPSHAEWTAALNTTGGVNTHRGAAANLRDATWAAQKDHQIKRAQSGALPEYPDDGAYAPGVAVGAEAGHHTTNDGTLWFRSTAAGYSAGDSAAEAAGLRDMIGNVAEWVATYGDSAQLFRGDTGAGGQPVPDAADQVRAALRSGESGIAVGIVGGSALSPPSLSLTDKLAPPRRAWLAEYADVGFRLAFTASGRQPLAPRVQRLAQTPHILCQPTSKQCF